MTKKQFKKIVRRNKLERLELTLSIASSIGNAPRLQASALEQIRDLMEEDEKTT